MFWLVWHHGYSMFCLISSGVFLVSLVLGCRFVFVFWLVVLFCSFCATEVLFSYDL